jgi:hypothetical protein
MVRDDKKTRTKQSCHAELVSASGLFFSASGRRTFHPRPQDGVSRCGLNKRHHWGVERISHFSLQILITNLKETSNNYQFVTPAPYRVRGKLRRESSDVKGFWFLVFAGMTFLEVALNVLSPPANAEFEI